MLSALTQRKKMRGVNGRKLLEVMDKFMAIIVMMVS